MDLQSIFAVYSKILFTDFARYFVTAGLFYLVFWMVFKKQWSHRIIQQKMPSFKKRTHEFKYSMSTVLIFSINGFCIYLSKEAGFTMIYEDIATFGWGWLFLSFVLMLLIHDAYFYWMHRLMHHPKLYRHVHLVHHKSTNPSPWAAYSFHPIEALIEAGIFWIFVLFLPAHPLVLLSFLIFMIVRNVFGHLGIEILPKWFVHNKWLNWNTTTTHHDLHHKRASNNYGLYFTWWDKWCNTEDPAYLSTFEEVSARKKTAHNASDS